MGQLVVAPLLAVAGGITLVMWVYIGCLVQAFTPTAERWAWLRETAAVVVVFAALVLPTLLVVVAYQMWRLGVGDQHRYPPGAWVDPSRLTPSQRGGVLRVLCPPVQVPDATTQLPRSVALPGCPPSGASALHRRPQRTCDSSGVDGGGSTEIAQPARQRLRKPVWVGIRVQDSWSYV